MPAKKPAKTFNLQKASDLPDMEYLPTGIPELDAVITGFPRGQISEIFALEKVGKTTLTLMSIAELTRKKKRVIFVDVENSFNKDRAKFLGVNLDELIVAKEFILEDVVQLILENVENCDAIIIDSLPQLIPRREDQGEVGDANIGVKAKVINELCRRITPKIAKSKCAAIFINQMRPNMDPYGEKYIIPGGWAMRYAATLRLQLARNNSSDLIKKKTDGVEMQVGHKIHVKVKKTKNGSYEGKEITYELRYDDAPVIPDDEVEKQEKAAKKAKK